MNPYDVLGLPPEATSSQIKDAYRRAVKKFHPDVSSDGDNDSIKIVNEAYAILSDPERKARYDNGYNFVTEETHEQDPREIYKQEYRRRRRMEAEAKKVREENTYKVLYKINVAVFGIALVLVIDQWLPTLSYNEIVSREWVRDIHIRGGAYRVRYMKTENRTFAIPSDAPHFTYNYGKPDPMTIEVSPILRIPRWVEYNKDREVIGFEPARTIYSFVIPFHYILFLMGAVAVSMRRHSSFAFSYGFTPPLILILCAIIFLVFA